MSRYVRPSGDGTGTCLWYPRKLLFRVSWELRWRGCEGDGRREYNLRPVVVVGPLRIGLSLAGLPAADVRVHFFSITGEEGWMPVGVAVSHVSKLARGDCCDGRVL
jgi:hypothetical protein